MSVRTDHKLREGRSVAQKGRLLISFPNLDFFTPARTKFAVFPGTRGDGPVATLGVSLLSAPLRSDPLGLSNPAQRTPSKSAPSQSAIHTEVNGHRHKV